MNIFKRFCGHLKTVCTHKSAVYHQCKACGLGWQGNIHDMSKFSPVEFLSSVKYFQGNRSPIEAEKEAIGYSKGWLHHKGKNKHHWEYWCDFSAKDGHIIKNKMPKKYLVEMLCDWIGAGKAYLKENWNTTQPLKYYYKVQNGRHLHPDTEAMVVYFLTIVNDYGLEEFHRKVKIWLKEDVYKYEV